MSLVAQILKKYQEEIPPNELFHYTDQNGLLGIVNSQKFWTTDTKCLNDSSEYVLAFQIAESILNEFEYHHQFDKNTIYRLKSELEITYRSNVYVGSFSEDGDMLSQWRAYGSNKCSFSLGFRSQALIEIAIHQDFQLTRCVYDTDVQREIIRALIVDHYELYDSKWPILSNGEFSEELMSIAPLFKDRGFQEEQEWRLVSKRAVYPEKVQFRGGASFIIPYLPVDLTPVDDVLQSIIIGPTPYPEVSLKTLELLLAKENLRQSTASCSNIPFRNW